MSGILDLLDLPNIHYERSKDTNFPLSIEKNGTLPVGQYSYIWKDNNTVVCVRDPIGCNKLFFGELPDGRVAAANRITNLFDRGITLDCISSCPAGQAIQVVGNHTETVAKTVLSDITESRDFDPSQFQHSVRERLSMIFESLRNEFPRARFVVCLSGGLDSSVVAYFAKQFLDPVRTICFSFLDDLGAAANWDSNNPTALSGASEDFYAAANVANAIGLSLDPVFRTREDVSAAIPKAVGLCQDWRDFNVHCAIVNVFLAEGLSEMYGDQEVVVLTGDLMNEYVCDYKEEIVDGQVYYPQPRLRPGQYRRFLVRGLDAGDREIGVFNHFGLIGCQPFAGVGDLFMKVPNRILENDNCKEYLNGALLPADVREVVNPRKTRAQVGGLDMGTLGVCHALNFGSAEFLRIWSQEFPGEKISSVEDLISVGRYRTARKGRQ